MVPPNTQQKYNSSVGGRGVVRLRGDWGLAIGDWRLAIGDWRLAIGDWRLAIGDWGLAIGDWGLPTI
jgi:hypothetical protein